MHVLIALILALTLQSPSPATKPKNPAVQNSEAADKTGDSKQTSPLVPSNTPVSTPVSQPTADDKKDDHHGESDKRVYRVEIISKQFDWLYVIYIFVTSIAAFVAWRALIAIRKQGETMEGQIKEMKAAGIQTEKLIDAAAKSADAAKASTDALIASERAWVMVELASHDLIVSDDGEEASLSLRIIYRNAGRTPAWITEGQIYFELVDLIPETPDFSDNGWYIEPKWLSNRRTEKRVLTWKGNPSEDGSAKNRIIYGVIKYRDVLGGSRTTAFGYQFDMFDKPRIIAKYNKNT